MLMNNHRFVSVSALALCSSLAFSACGKDEKDAAAGATSGLVGSWAEACVKNGNEWRTSIDTYTATAISGVYKGYSKEGCAAADLAHTSTISGEYTVSGNKIDANITKLTVTPHTDAPLAVFKTVCASLTWAKDKETDVSTCDQFKVSLKKVYSIYKIEDTKLFKGKKTDALDGSADAKRHTEYDTAEVRTKQ